MMAESTNIETYKRALDEAQRHAPDGSEYWLARDLQAILNYARWENFIDVVRKSMLACDSGGVPSEHHFRQTAKVMTYGKGSQRKIEDWFLSRFACYLVAMNGDPHLPQVAYAQKYFAWETRLREQETEAMASLGYDRVAHRIRVAHQTKSLNMAAKKAGVFNYALFHDAGTRGLYGGLHKAEIKRKKSIPDREEILDCAGRAELAAVEFKATQTEQKLLRDGVSSQERAMLTHHDVGVEVRAAIERIGGTMPEDLPAEASIKKQVAERRRKLIPRLSQ